MHKKVLVWLLVILLLCGLAVPAFATSPGGNTTDSVNHPAVVIDYLRFNNGEHAGAVLDWPNNYSVGGQSLYGNIDGVFTFDAFYTGSAFRTTVYTGNCDYFTLFCSEYFWSDSQHFAIDSYGSLTFNTVTISGEVCYIQPAAGQYYLESQSFSMRSSIYSSEVYLDDLIGEAISDYTNLYSGSYAFLQNVTISLSFNYSSSEFARFRTVIPLGPKPSAYREFWFSSQKLTYSLSDSGAVSNSFNMFDWLVDSANAFLELEIAPGFSINMIFYIVLVIGVLFWFIKLLI